MRNSNHSIPLLSRHQEHFLDATNYSFSTRYGQHVDTTCAQENTPSSKFAIKAIVPVDVGKHPIVVAIPVSI
jgi:hypothetical protein